MPNDLPETQPLRPYTEVMQKDAQEAFNRVYQVVNKGLAEGTLDFTRKEQFWLDFLTLMEYNVLK